MSTAEDAYTAIAEQHSAFPLPAHRAIGQGSGMRLIPLRSGPFVAMLMRLLVPTRKGRSPHGTR